jgi:hypothetical protein
MGSLDDIGRGGQAALKILSVAALLVLPPLIGVWLAGEPIGPYLAFPPEFPPPPSPPFSWFRFGVIALLVLAVLAPFLYVVLRSQARSASRSSPQRRLPWWGWLGLLWLLASWVVAWNRFGWVGAWQAHTFTPIWLGYIVFINGLCYRRTGRCLLTDRPGLLLLLFPASSLFWWFFEYLNRFAQNWSYQGAGELDDMGYLIAASLPFATVLPAVLSTRDYLSSFPRLYAGLGEAWRPPRLGRRWAVGALLVAAGSLVALPLLPLLLYPMVWLAPLVIAIALQAVFGERTALDPILDGDWRPIWLAALAALLCGFLWELWNWQSLARWEYHVPYVDRFRLFEMPLLGYAGYLPFGLQCVAAASLFFGARAELVYGLPLTSADARSSANRC